VIAYEDGGLGDYSSRESLRQRSEVWDDGGSPKVLRDQLVSVMVLDVGVSGGFWRFGL